MKINNILIRPVVTEKATNLIGNKVYTFETNLRADKHKIKEALEKLYKVKVKKVRIMIRVGKKRMVVKKLANKKIALIELSEGKIELFPQA